MVARKKLKKHAKVKAPNIKLANNLATPGVPRRQLHQAKVCVSYDAGPLSTLMSYRWIESSIYDRKGVWRGTLCYRHSLTSSTTLRRPHEGLHLNIFSQDERR